MAANSALKPLTLASDAKRRATLWTQQTKYKPWVGLVDFWYLDDGDILCHPQLVVPYLQAFDEANAQIGAVRNPQKTEVLYYTSSESLEQQRAPWQLDLVKEKATVHLASEGTLTLGVATGPPETITNQLEKKTHVVKAMHERVQLCQSPQTEFVLARDSLGVGRVNHILRVHGHRLAEQDGVAAKFDEVGRHSLERLFPGTTPEGSTQASLNDKAGGLGWRRALDIARPAHLGGLIAVRPRIRAMFESCGVAGLLDAARLETRLDSLIADAKAAYLQTLDEVDAVRAEEFFARAQNAAQESWDNLLNGVPGRGPPAPRVLLDDGERADDDNVARAGQQQPRLSSSHLQRELSMLSDRTKARRLADKLKQQGAWQQLQRFTEIRHKEVSHRWLSNLDPKSGSVLASADFTINVQKRIGCRSYAGSALCRVCGVPLDAYLEHSETCSTSEATRGHYACVRSLVNGFRLADPAVTTEPRGLTSRTSRPADIFTTAAVPRRGAALDVCVASPNAAAAMGDAAAAAFRRKLRRYRREIRELNAANIAFRPLVWTADGRPHPAATRTLRYAADIAITRSSDESSAAALVSRWKHEIQIAILRRRAAMARAVLPKATVEEAWLLTGRAQRDENTANTGYSKTKISVMLAGLSTTKRTAPAKAVAWKRRRRRRRWRRVWRRDKLLADALSRLPISHEASMTS